MTQSMKINSRQCFGRRLLTVFVISASALCCACFDGKDAVSTPYRVGTETFDPNLPPEPQLPTEDQVCATLYASDLYVKRPDGALPPEADPVKAGAAADRAIVNPDQDRIQAALDACYASVRAEVGDRIIAADAQAAAAQYAERDNGSEKLVAGILGEEYAKPEYRASKYAVRLVKSNTGPGDSFITGQLWLPSGVTLWIDEGVTLFGTRDVMGYQLAEVMAGESSKYCGNTAVGNSDGASSNCNSLINGRGLVNSAVMGDGVIDGRAYSELVSSEPLFPLIRVDMTCSNTYDAYKQGKQAPSGTACDNGGTFVKGPSEYVDYIEIEEDTDTDGADGGDLVAAVAVPRNMTWWDLAWLGNMVQNGQTSAAHQSNPRIMTFKFAKNLTLYRITLTNSPNFHVVPSGVDGLTVWGVKVMTPSTAAYANPAGNLNPLYTGEYFDHYNVKNTDAFDPASEDKWGVIPLNEKYAEVEGDEIHFDGYLKNVVFAYNYVSTGDDDIVLKGSKNPAGDDSPLPGVDGNMDVRADRTWGIIIAHNHIYWGHGISIGSETNSGVTNVHVYDNSFWGSEEALRIKSDYARGGEVTNIFYDNICIRDVENALLYTTYYSTRALEETTDLLTNVTSYETFVPNFHDIFMNNVKIEGETTLRFEGFEANSGGFEEPAHPLIMTLSNVVSDDPEEMGIISSEAELTLKNVNLPIQPSEERRVVVHGEASLAVDPETAVDCSAAFVDFPSHYSIFRATWEH